MAQPCAECPTQTQKERKVKSGYLGVQEVADLLGMAAKTVQAKAGRNAIPHRKVAGCRRLMFIEHEIDAWVEGAELECIPLARGGRIVRPKT